MSGSITVENWSGQVLNNCVRRVFVNGMHLSSKVTRATRRNPKRSLTPSKMVSLLIWIVGKYLMGMRVVGIPGH